LKGNYIMKVVIVGGVAGGGSCAARLRRLDEEAELCYAPQFGSAKDPVNFAGMVAADILRDDMPISHWSEAKDGFLLDVRHPVELAVENVPGSSQYPVGRAEKPSG
jgi:hypothetical protein